MELSGFHKKSVKERLDMVASAAGLSDEEKGLLLKEGALDLEKASIMIENVIGTFQLPFGIATNFLVNGRDVLVPMVIEEPSVVAGASKAAKLARQGGGFSATASDPVMIGQVQLTGVKDIGAAKKAIEARKQDIMDIANRADSILVGLGGGMKDLELRELDTPKGRMLIVHLLVDVRDAMGANAVNTMAERVSPILEEASGGQARLRIISNLATHRTVRASARWRKEDLGDAAIEGILEAYAFADNDQFRGTTHNKGIMNGIDAVALATGNDFRAVEAGCHSFAAMGGYRSLTRYEKDADGNLVGSIEIPLAVGVVGGSMRTNPMARVALKILGVKTARELSEVMASVGLAQNFAALHALATEGIQRGHMRLHAKNIAVTAGARGEEIEKVASKLVESGEVSVGKAKELLGG